MLYLPIATPGSGKSYLADKMVEGGLIEADAVVSPDRYREILTGERANQNINKEVFQIVDTIVDSRITHGLDVYLDATNLNAKLRDRLLQRLFALDGSLDLTILLSEAPRSLVERRNRDRAHPVPDHVLERFSGLLESFDVQPYVDTYGAAVQSFEDVLTSMERAQARQIQHVCPVSEDDWEWVVEIKEEGL